MSDQPEHPTTHVLRQLAASLESATQTITVPAAMGWMMRGDLTQARACLAALPTARLTEVSAAAAALSSLADETAGANR